jgi:hypothetical protein
MDPGFYRVRLEADDDDWMTLVVPLDDHGRIAPAVPGPHLFKARWNGDEFYGELALTGEPRFVWGADARNSLTNITSVALAEWAKVTIWQEDSRDSAEFVFRVRSLERLQLGGRRSPAT